MPFNKNTKSNQTKYLFLFNMKYFDSISSLIQISLNIIDIFCLHIFFWIPFLLPYCFYRIRRELIDVFSIIVDIPSTFCPTLDHHQGRIYNKRDVNFVFAYYYYVRASLPLFLQSVICLFTGSHLYSKVMLYLWAAGSWSLKYVYFGSISSLIQISLNITDIFCLHIFFWVRIAVF